MVDIEGSELICALIKNLTSKEIRKLLKKFLFTFKNLKKMFTFNGKNNDKNQ